MKRNRTEAFGERPQVGFFWQNIDQNISDSSKLPKLAELSVKSYLLQGHPVKVWTYHKSLTNLPQVEGKHVDVCDAREIISEKEYRS